MEKNSNNLIDKIKSSIATKKNGPNLLLAECALEIKKLEQEVLFLKRELAYYQIGNQAQSVIKNDGINI